VPPNDDVALAGALQTLLDDRSLAERLGAAGQARAADEYDQTVFVRRVESLYRRLAQSRCSLP
jgi:glycosyltransferase involved in cell wall biosynthesis